MREVDLEHINANEENIRNIRDSLLKRAEEAGGKSTIFTMFQRNAPCNVHITEGSRKVCANTVTSLYLR